MALNWVNGKVENLSLAWERELGAQATLLTSAECSAYWAKLNAEYKTRLEALKAGQRDYRR